MINYKDKTLIGAGLFFSGKSATSWIVKIGGLLTPKHGLKVSKFSHVGTLMWNELTEEIDIIEAIKPNVLIRPLREAMADYKNNNYEVVRLPVAFQVQRDILNRQIVASAKHHVGWEYSNYTAVFSEIDLFKDGSRLSKWFNKKAKPKKRIHCSGLDAKIMVECGIIKNIDYIDCTPDDCYQLRVQLIK